MTNEMTRREFVRDSAAAMAGHCRGTGLGRDGAAGNPTGADTSKILNYNPDMEYRRCGKTGMMVSAVALGGHWKRVVKVIGGEEAPGWMTMDIDRPEFQKNRHDVVSRCIERGINYVDACCGEEILAYCQALEGPPRQDVLRLLLARQGEPLSANGGPPQKLKQGLDEGMKEAGLEYVDLWRISLLTDSSQHSEAEIEEVVAALDWAKKTGRARFIGVSSHDRPHLKKMIEKYPEQIEVILTPYTAKTKVVEDETRPLGGDPQSTTSAGSASSRSPATRSSRATARRTARTPRKTTASPGWRSATSSAIRRSPRPCPA